jgi:hypothetical protein
MLDLGRVRPVVSDGAQGRKFQMRSVNMRYGESSPVA